MVCCTSVNRRREPLGQLLGDLRCARHLIRPPILRVLDFVGRLQIGQLGPWILFEIPHARRFGTTDLLRSDNPAQRPAFGADDVAEELQTLHERLGPGRTAGT